jgi:folate-binding Fe-S cluster repair protein YgfZ
LEAGLKWAVSFNKGCYVGQEIIARMETYQRLAKRLAVLDCSLEAGAAGVGMASGDVLHAGDAQVGHVTSVAPLIDQGVIKALAYVKTPLAAAGNEVQVISRGGSCAATLSAVVGEGL